MNPDELARMRAQSADARLADMQAIREALRDNPEVSGSAADAYIDDALNNLTSARVDMRDAIENHSP